jgi:hypothetical protein
LIDAKKVKMMTRLAIYDQTDGKKDRLMHRYSRNVYLGIRRLINFVTLTIIYLCGAGIYCFRYVDDIFSKGFGYEYKPLAIRLLLAYVLTLIVGLIIMERVCIKQYDRMIQNLEKYDHDLYHLEKYIRSKESGE